MGKKVFLIFKKQSILLRNIKWLRAVFIESSINESSIQAVIEGEKSDGVEVTLGGELFSDDMGKAGTEEGKYIGMYSHNINTIYYKECIKRTGRN